MLFLGFGFSISSAPMIPSARDSAVSPVRSTLQPPLRTAALTRRSEPYRPCITLDARFESMSRSIGRTERSPPSRVTNTGSHAFICAAIWRTFVRLPSRDGMLRMAATDIAYSVLPIAVSVRTTSSRTCETSFWSGLQNTDAALRPSKSALSSPTDSASTNLRTFAETRSASGIDLTARATFASASMPRLMSDSRMRRSVAETFPPSAGKSHLTIWERDPRSSLSMRPAMLRSSW